MRELFGPERVEMRGDWRKLHNDVLCEDEVGYVAYSGRERNAYRILVGKPDRRRWLGRPRHRWDCTMKIFLQEENGRVWTGFI